MNSSVKKTRKLTSCALISAVSLLCMFTAYLPYFTYCAPLIAGAVLSVLVIEFDKKWATASFAVVSFLGIILCGEKEAAMLFVGFFGYYPILKSVFEKLNNRAAEYLLKLLCFNIGMVLSYLIIIFIFKIPLETNGILPFKLFVILLLAAGNAVFVFYDFALSRFISFYMVRYHNKISSMMK